MTAQVWDFNILAEIGTGDAGTFPVTFRDSLTITS